MRRIKKLGLVWKLTLMMSVLLLILTTLICIIYFQTFKRSFLEEEQEKLHGSVQQMQNHIDKSLGDANSMLDELFYNQEFRYYLDDQNQLSENEQRFYISNLEQVLANSRYLYKQKFKDLGIHSANEQIDEASYDWQFYLKDLKEKPYYREIIQNGNDEESKDTSIYGEVRKRGLISTNLKTSQFKLGDSGIRILPIYRKVLSTQDQELIGVVEIDVDVSRLAEKDLLKQQDEKMGNLLLDQKHNVLFDTFSFTEDEEQEIIKCIEGNSGTADVKIGDYTYMVAYDTCDETGLIKAAISSKEEIMGYIRDQVVRIILFAVVCLLILAALIFYFVRSMLTRLLVLDQMMGKVGKGDFTVAIQDDYNEDEISRITESFNRMTAQLDTVMEDKVQYEKAQKDAEIRALQAQINPHFLYNTLENMRMQCEVDEYYTISNSLSALSNLFRYSIRWGNNEVPFELEWKNLKDYLEIMKMRFDDDVEFDLNCGAGLNEIVVPKLILQPLVENCFNHGFKGELPPWRLSITVSREDDDLLIIIADNGKGIPPERMERLQNSLRENKPFRSEERRQNSIGITNVKQRIDMICREGSSLQIESTPGAGTTITIRIKC